jgi:hypothetical protein
MKRREALQLVAVMMGGTLATPALAGMLETDAPALRNAPALLFDQPTEDLIAEIAEVIIPTTDTPGAKAAGVGPFINLFVTDCYTEPAQKAFKLGVDKIERDSKAAFGKSFKDASVDQKTMLLKIAEGDAKAAQQAGMKDPQFFRTMKELTLFGYFTSEIGCTQALAYEYVPGRYEGCTPMKPGQKAWAT